MHPKMAEKLALIKHNLITWFILFFALMLAMIDKLLFNGISALEEAVILETGRFR